MGGATELASECGRPRGLSSVTLEDAREDAQDTVEAAAKPTTPWVRTGASPGLIDTQDGVTKL